MESDLCLKQNRDILQMSEHFFRLVNVIGNNLPSPSIGHKKQSLFK